jgi:hypothetical protein
VENLLSVDPATELSRDTDARVQALADYLRALGQVSFDAFAA